MEITLVVFELLCLADKLTSRSYKKEQHTKQNTTSSVADESLNHDLTEQSRELKQMYSILFYSILFYALGLVWGGHTEMIGCSAGDKSPEGRGQVALSCKSTLWHVFITNTSHSPLPPPSGPQTLSEHFVCVCEFVHKCLRVCVCVCVCKGLGPSLDCKVQSKAVTDELPLKS